MRNWTLLSAVVLALSVRPGLARAEVPPLDQAELDEKADLIVTGVITQVKISRSAWLEDETWHDFTVQVRRVDKGGVRPGASVVARGTSIKLSQGRVGRGGHYAYPLSPLAGRVTDLGPGWEVKLYLHPPTDGVREILAPNGYVALAAPPVGVAPEAPAAVAQDWSWLIAAAVVATFAALVGAYRVRSIRQRAVGEPRA